MSLKINSKRLIGISMKLQLHTTGQQHQIKGVDADSITVNEQRFDKTLIVSGDQLISDWFNAKWDQLDHQAFEPVLGLKPDVVLLGTGDKHRFIHPKHIRAFAEAHIAVECMTTAAACRTFNVLMSEGRRVVAALLLEKNL